MSTNSSFLSNIFMAAYIETQSLSKTVFKPTVWKRYMIFFPMGHKYPRHGRFLQIHGTSKLTSPYFSTGYEIYARNMWHWDNLFIPRCIPRHNIQRKMRKSYHWRKDVYTFSPLTTHRMLKWIWPMDLALSILRTNSSEEVFQISKSGWRKEAGHIILK